MFSSTFYVSYVVSHTLAAGIAAGLGAYIYWTRWEKSLAKPFVAMVSAFAVWTTFSLVRIFATDPTAYVALTALKYVGVATAPVWFFLFALVHADREQFVTRVTVAGLCVVPVATVALVATNHYHGLFYSGFSPTTVAGLQVLDTVRGPAFWAFAVYGWGLLAVGSGLLVYSAYRLPPVFRTHAVLIAVGIAVPWTASLGYIFYDWPHTAVDPTPLGFAAASALWAVGVFTTDLVNISPVARSRVVSALDNPVVVLDDDDRVIDVNDAATLLLDTSTPHGGNAADVLPPTLAAIVEAGIAERDSEPVELSVGNVTRHFQYRFWPLGRDGEYGAVLILSDVTELVEVRQRLEERNRALARQNDRLDEFASVMSHDLRNPLTVARGNLELLAEETDSEFVAPIERSLEQMEARIEGVLTLARQGQVVGEPTAVDVAESVSLAWANVDSADATLGVEDDPGVVEADESRLVRLLENLFRNSVEHGSTGSQTARRSSDAVEHGVSTVTVRVGSLPRGFYVEDDGPGIPESDRAEVFEYGFTTTEDGTGFGLNIVRTIVEAHGWTIRLGDGVDGGARFEIDTAGESDSAETAAEPLEAS